MISMNPEILATLDRVPELETVDRAAISLEKLGGLTNKNYKVTTPLGVFVLRIPGAGTSEYISRENESLAARITSEIGVNAPLIYFDARDGVQLTRFIEGGVTMNPERFKDLGSVRRAAQSLRRVHDRGRPFKNRFELFQMIDEYLDVL